MNVEVKAGEVMMETATSFWAPFVLLPRRLVGEWYEALGENSDPESGLYGDVCQEASRSFMHVVSFRGAEVLRVADPVGDVVWVPADSGGLLLQVIAADSLEDLVDLGRKIAEANVWEESLEFEVGDADVRIMGAYGFEDDGQSAIDAELAPGRHRVDATYGEDEEVGTEVVVFRLTRIG